MQRWIIPAASQHRANSGSSASSRPPFTIKLFDCQTVQQPSASLLMEVTLPVTSSCTNSVVLILHVIGETEVLWLLLSTWWDSQNYYQTVHWCRAPGFLLMHDNASLNASLKCVSSSLIQPKSWAHHACHCLTGTYWCPHPVQRRSSFFGTYLDVISPSDSESSP